MKSKIFGLKKGPIEEVIQKMESDFLSERTANEHELKGLIEENNKLRDSIKEKPKMNLNIYEKEPLGNYDKNRMKGVINYLREQHEHDIGEVRKRFSERKKVIQLQIKEIDEEIQSAEQLYANMFNLMTDLVEQDGKMDVMEKPKKEEIKKDETKKEKPKIVETNKEEVKVVNFQIEHPVRLLVAKSLKSEETVSDMSGEQNDLIEQIDAIKSQYIVGKVAGEDLVDVQGNLLLAKFDIITKQVVDQAHREGKLADLILNMKISGLGED